MIVVFILFFFSSVIISAALLWCDEMKCRLRRNCSKGRFSPCLLTRCWYSEESISSISRTASRTCRLRSFNSWKPSSKRESSCQKRDSELSKILLLLFCFRERLVSSCARDSFGLWFQFPDVIANWEAFSRSVFCMGYSIPFFSKSSCAIANADCMADVPVLPCPICK